MNDVTMEEVEDVTSYITFLKKKINLIKIHSFAS